MKYFLLALCVCLATVLLVAPPEMLEKLRLRGTAPTPAPATAAPEFPSPGKAPAGPMRGWRPQPRAGTAAPPLPMAPVIARSLRLEAVEIDLEERRALKVRVINLKTDLVGKCRLDAFWLYSKDGQTHVRHQERVAVDMASDAFSESDIYFPTGQNLDEGWIVLLVRDNQVLAGCAAPPEHLKLLESSLSIRRLYQLGDAAARR